MSDIDTLIRMRNRFLALSATSFLLWQGMQIVQEIFPDSGAYGLLTLFALIGSLGFVGAMVMFLTYASRVTRTNTQAMIQDELFDHNQARAVRIAFIALMAALVALYVLTDFVVLDVDLIIRGLLIVAVCVPQFAFLVLDRTGNDGGAE
ncbi:hypothetical protein [Maricaulis sp.]|uniref:hypothetical protein n=1 Tax=Maricaulis sp. TaxID=1486257 RepID=UPI003A8DAFF1